MYKKEYRLRRKKDFDFLFKQGYSKYNQILGIKKVANNQDKSRFGVIVSNKISKKAVERNRLKRKLREIIRLNIPNIKDGFDIAVIALPPARDKNYRELERSLSGLLKQLKLFKDL